jgi:hypothetical protein
MLCALCTVPTIPRYASVVKEPCRGHEGTGGDNKGKEFRAGKLFNFGVAYEVSAEVRTQLDRKFRHWNHITLLQIRLNQGTYGSTQCTLQRRKTAKLMVMRLRR